MYFMVRGRRGLSLTVALMILTLGAGEGRAGSVAERDEILTLSLEDLLNVKVTSVSKRAQPLSDAAAAIYVITTDDIERSGATNLPDVLRMVPGLHVGRIDGSKWAVTARGFNGRFSNKLLVLVDGRSVYTSSFSGVYWEVQDVLLADIDRIEIIRGPGSTLWGANAVNGVINIITKHAADTQGGYLTTTVGSEVRGIGGFRYGTTLGDGTYLRAHAKAAERDGFLHTDGSDAHDGWHLLSCGFRLDASVGQRDALTFQGDLYDGNMEQEVDQLQLTPPYESIVLGEAVASGGNLLGRWERTVSPTSSLTAQAYYNRYDRAEVYAHEIADEVDLDIQHSFAAGAHDFVWGGGYRRIRNDLLIIGGSVPTAVRVDNLYSAFLQDQISAFDERLSLTLGSKVEHNTYTQYEIQPSARMMWRLETDHRVWAAVSRAVRTPSRVERELRILRLILPPGSPHNPAPMPVAIYAQGSDDFRAEELLAYELGYRFAGENLSVDMALFLNDYDNLRTGRGLDPVITTTHIEVVQELVTTLKDRSYGGELSAVWRAMPNWRWDVAYAYYQRDFTDYPAESRKSSEVGPRHRLSVRSSLQPHRHASLDLWLRFVDECHAFSSDPNAFNVEAYTTLDARLGLALSKDVTLSLVGQNLFDDERIEYAQEAFTRSSEIQRGYYVRLEWRF